MRPSPHTHTMSSSGTPHLVDELESAFQDCLALLTNQEFFNVTDLEETKASIEQTTQHFVDVSRQLETSFLQSRFLLSLHKPEQIIKEDIQELKAELQRKEALITRHHEHLQQWQVLLGRAGGQGPQQGQGQPATSAGSVGPGGQVQSATPVPTQVMPPPLAQGSYPQGPLAYLEQTTSNIGMPERR